MVSIYGTHSLDLVHGDDAHLSVSSLTHKMSGKMSDYAKSGNL